MSGSLVRGSEAIRAFEPLHGMTDIESSGRTLNAASFIVPATPLRVPNPLTRANRSMNDAMSRSHLYSPTVSHIVDSTPVREVFHLSPSTARMAIDPKWRSIDEEDERPQEVDNRGYRSSKGNHDSSISRQESFDLTSDSADPLSPKVVVS